MIIWLNYEWSQKWLVTFNLNKTNVLMFSQRKMPNEPHLVFGNSVLNLSKTHKYFGLTFSAEAKWSSYTQRVQTSVINGIITKKNIF